MFPPDTWAACVASAKLTFHYSKIYLHNGLQFTKIHRGPRICQCAFALQEMHLTKNQMSKLTVELLQCREES